MRRIRRFGQHYPFITNRVAIYDSLVARSIVRDFGEKVKSLQLSNKMIATSHLRDYYQTNTSVNSLNIGSIVKIGNDVYNMYKPDVNYDSNWNLVQDQKSDNVNYGISWNLVQE